MRVVLRALDIGGGAVGDPLPFLARKTKHIGHQIQLTIEDDP